MNDDYEFLAEAIKGGTIQFVRRDPWLVTNRCLVTVGNISRPMDITDELWRDLGLLKEKC